MKEKPRERSAKERKNRGKNLREWTAKGSRKQKRGRISQQKKKLRGGDDKEKSGKKVKRREGEAERWIGE